MAKEKIIHELTGRVRKELMSLHNLIGREMLAGELTWRYAETHIWSKLGGRLKHTFCQNLEVG